jgi:hypothetical protein
MTAQVINSRFSQIELRLIALSAAALLAFFTFPAWSQAAPPSGQWEGVIAFPKMPWVVNVNFDTRTATIDQLGTTPIPLQSISLKNGAVSFSMTPNSHQLAFGGRFEGSILIGNVLRSGRAFPFSFRLLRPLPNPSSRLQAWQQDLEAAQNLFLAYDRSFSLNDRSEFIQAIQDLEASLPTLSDEQVIVRLSRAVALAHNAHTRLYLLRTQTVLRRYPVRVWWFNEGLYVVKAAPPYQRTIACQVLKIGNHDAKSVRASVRTLFSGNESWTDYISTYYMTSPEILYGLGLVPDLQQADFSFACKDGEFSTTVKPLPLEKRDKPVEAWWDLSPLHNDDSASFVQALENRSADLPLYIRHPDDYYWFSYLPAQRAVYFQYNKSLEQPQGEPFRQFAARLLRFVNEQNVAALILDLRFNTGGDLTIASPLMHDLHDVMRGKRVFVVTGRATFSAGLYHAAHWKEMGGTTIVGEMVGDALDFWAEGAVLTLPNSRLGLRYANGFHKYSTRDYPMFKPYFMELNVASLVPDVPITVSAEDYFSARDPVLNYIITELSAGHRTQ